MQYYDTSAFLEKHPIIATLFGCDGIHIGNGLYHIAPYELPIRATIVLVLYFLYCIVLMGIWYNLKTSWTVILTMTSILGIFTLGYFLVFFSFYVVWKYRYTYRWQAVLVLLLMFLGTYISYNIGTDYLNYRTFVETNNLETYMDEAKMNAYRQYDRVELSSAYRKKVWKETHEIFQKLHIGE